jgi:hypothetical protein
MQHRPACMRSERAHANNDPMSMQGQRRRARNARACWRSHYSIERAPLAAPFRPHPSCVSRRAGRKFFPSIDHAILRPLLQRTTPLPWRWLRDRFLDAPYVGEQVQYHFTGDDRLTPLQRPHGLPIGSLTSQLWANAYLSPLDHILASHLGLGSFGYPPWVGCDRGWPPRHLAGHCSLCDGAKVDCGEPLPRSPGRERGSG